MTTTSATESQLQPTHRETPEIPLHLQWEAESLRSPLIQRGSKKGKTERKAKGVRSHSIQTMPSRKGLIQNFQAGRTHCSESSTLQLHGGYHVIENAPQAPLPV